MESQDRLVGQVLDDKYSIERKLGQGGMGAVYFATHLGTSRPVALKVITPKYMANEDFVRRFKREAKAAGLLRHPNIVDVTDFGFTELGHERLAYLVMEYLDGCTLADVLKEEKSLPPKAAVDILEQVCLAIGKAHEHGIVHRDLKPDNIWLEPDERGGFKVKVLDFGLAKVAANAPSGPALPPVAQASDQQTTVVSGSQPTDIVQAQATAEATQIQASPEATQIQAARSPAEKATEIIKASPTAGFAGKPTDTLLYGAITRVGAILGTPLYMSPEQYSGDKLTAASDIYSLGVIAYEMLAGETPFTGNLFSLMQQHVQAEPPPLRQKNGKVRKGVEQVVMSALAKDPAARPATAAAFASALRARSEGPGAILSRAFGLYSEHFPLFFRISLIAYLPMLVSIIFWVCGRVLVHFVPSVAMAEDVLSVAFYDLGQLFAWVISIGVLVPVTAQLLIAPLRPVEIRPAIDPLKKRLRPFVVASLLFNTLVLVLLIYEDAALGVFNGAMGEASMLHRLLESITHSIARAVMIDTWIVVALTVPALLALRAIFYYLLYAPVIAMEGGTSTGSFARSKELVRRSAKTVTRLLAIFLLVMGLESGFCILVDTYFSQGEHTLLSSVAFGAASRLIAMAVSLMLNPVVAVSLALLYFKSRQAGGETLKQILGDYQKEMLPIARWQDRMLKRLSIRISRSSNPTS